MIYRCLCLLLSILLGMSAVQAQEEQGYRGPPYKSPTPWTAPGATTLYFAEEVQDLINHSDVVLINVSPITLSPEDSDGNRIWITRADKPVKQIPGSIWLPNVGYQVLDSGMQAYFSKNLAHYTGENKKRPILFYCTADCWMSWNAVKRAGEEYGYESIYWYPYGVDGWAEQDYVLEPANPVDYNLR